MEEDIFKALCFQDVITGTTVVLLYAGKLQGPIISKPFKAKMGSCSTHDIQFTQKKTYIILLSGIS